MKRLKEFRNHKAWLLKETELPDVCGKGNVTECDLGGFWRGSRTAKRGAGLADQGDALLHLPRVPLYLYVLHIAPLYSLKHT